MAIIATFPTTLVNGTTGDATQVMLLFDFIQTQVNGNALNSSSDATLTGNLSVIPATATGTAIVRASGGQSAALQVSSTSSGMILNKPATSGMDNFIAGQTNGVDRWLIDLGNTTAETGANTGSDFTISRWSDAGTAMDTPLTITRSTGSITLGGAGVTTLSNGAICGSTGINYSSYDPSFAIAWRWGASLLQAFANGTLLGNVTLTSDYRAKRDIEPLPSMWDTVKALKPISYKLKDWSIIKGDDVTHWGFIAHELQETLIEDAASGKKDEENVIQSPNLMTVVASLTRALQEAMARIEALETRLAAEGR